MSCRSYVVAPCPRAMEWASFIVWPHIEPPLASCLSVTGPLTGQTGHLSYQAPLPSCSVAGGASAGGHCCKDES